MPSTFRRHAPLITAARFLAVADARFFEIEIAFDAPPRFVGDLARRAAACEISSRSAAISSRTQRRALRRGVTSSLRSMRHSAIAAQPAVMARPQQS